MTTAIILRIIVVAAGVLLLGAVFITYAHRRFTEMIGLGWGMVAVILILLGAVPGLSAWSRLASAEYIAMYVMLALGLVIMYALSVSISVLTMKNQELAMQVSLLNQENEGILIKLKEIEDEKETTICN